MPELVLDARTATDHFPGIGRYVVNLARAMAQLEPGLDLRLLVDPRAATTRLALPDLPRIPCPASPFSLRQQWLVPRALRAARATFYHSPYYLMPYAPGVPAALTCYDLIPLRFPAYFGAARRLAFTLGHRLGLAAARVVFAISQATRSDLARYFGLPPERIAVTSLAADPRLTPRPPGEVEMARRKLGLPQPYVLYVGSNKPHKNLPRLVQAFARATEPRGSSAERLVVAGHWDERYPEARQLVEQSGWQHRVTFAGPVAEAGLAALYSGAALFVFPSLYEGFGLPVLEAMACGAPVACSAASSLPEVAGDAALLFDPSDVDAMAQVIAQALASADLRAELSARGLAQARRFSWARTARATLDAIAL